MGKIEQSARNLKKKEDLQKATLQILGAAGTLALAAVAPKMFTVLRKKSITSNRARSVVERLVAKKLVIAYEKGGEMFVRLTPEGEKVVNFQKIVLAAKEKRRPKWDGRWRVVTFDIPEARRRTRRRLVESLVEIGFLNVQGSVWIFPYDCEELVALIKAEMAVGKEVLHMIVSSMGDDQKFRRHFDLR